MMNGLTFGEFFRQKRLGLKLTLREFSNNKGLDPAYVSRLENELMKPPEDKEKLKALAIALEISQDTVEWVKFFDLASASQRSIPDDLFDENPNLIKFLPAFYRTARKTDVSKDDLDNLIKLLKGQQ